MKIMVWFTKSNSAKIFSDVHVTYQKGDLFCIELDNDDKIKIPLRNIFCIKELFPKAK